jgi:predicted nucleotidyltransferase
VNTKHPLFKELKIIVSKTIGVEGSLKTMLSSVHGIRIAFVYGSFAGRKEKGSSDIDLMIIGNPDTSLLNEKIAELEKRLRREINPTIYSMEEYRAKKKGKSGFILELLKKPKIMLIGNDNDL